MAPELSSNWKKLQEKIQANTTSKRILKRKAEEEQARRDPPRKKHETRAGKPFSTSFSSSGGREMGVTQSSEIDKIPENGVAPSLALWAQHDDISPEAVAEAYGLGVKSNELLANDSRPNEGLAPDVEVGKYVAIDCEMVGVGEGGRQSALARVSIVDFHGRQIYDSFVRPKEKITDWRTHVSGVSARHMCTARAFDDVQAKVADLLRERILVAHDVRHDLQALELDHPARMLRDTAKFSSFRKYGHGPRPALKVLAKELLGVEIQNGPHSSIEDARVTMLLFRKHKSGFDMEQAKRYPNSVARPGRKTAHVNKTKKK